jgi:hypothetical protein
MAPHCQTWLLPELERMLMVGGWPSPGDSGIAATVLAVRLLLGFVFVLAGLAKLRDLPGFRRAVDRYRLLPGSLVEPLATVVAWTEVAAGGALAAGIATPLAAGLVTAQLIGFATAMGINLVRGRDIECGCAGTSSGTTISWRLVARNAALAVPAAGVAVLASGRVEPALAPVPASDVVGVALTVVAVLGAARLLMYSARVRAALAESSAAHVPRLDRSLAGRDGVAG